MLLAGLASPQSYDQFSAGVADKRCLALTCSIISISFPSLPEIFPALASGGTALGQAGSQILAIIITLGMAVTGGLITGQLGFCFS